MKLKYLLSGILCVVLIASCGAPKEQEDPKVDEQKEMTSTESPQSANEGDTAPKLSVVEAMSKKLKEKGYAMTEEQLAQVQQVVDDLAIDVNDQSGDFKTKLKTLRQRIYDEILTEDQRTEFGGKMPKIEK